MRTHDRDGRSRRAVLRAGAAAIASAAAGLAVTGCDLLSGDPPPPAPPDPLAPLLAGTAELISRYDAALAAHPDLAPRLDPIRAAHQAHLTELAALIGTPAPGTPAPGGGTATSSPDGEPADARGTLTALRTAEAGGRQAAVTACLAAPADRTALLGSMAAARASHTEALR